MPHIVNPVCSSLLMQMLLDGNLYVAITWSFSYLVYMFVYVSIPHIITITIGSIPAIRIPSRRNGIV